jgi:Secretion system C-terminal sorting domain
MDSVTMLFDSVCMVLDVNFIDFNVVNRNGNAELNWQVSNNGEAASYEIEYSYNGSNFISLGSIPASNIGGNASYAFKYPLSSTPAGIVYYRIRANGKTGKMKYSKIISLRTSDNVNDNARVFPNPTNGDLWLSVNVAAKEIAELYIFNDKGQKVINSKISLSRGENLVQLPGLSGKPIGAYLVNIRMANGSITKKVLLLNK